MSAFALPVPPEGVAPLPSPAYGTLRYRVLAHAHSFGAWLEPRYIFGAGVLLDQ
jgi:hypothetical protein